MFFIVLVQQVSMHHIYNDIFHQAAVSQSLIIRINVLYFYTWGSGRPLGFSSNPENDVQIQKRGAEG